MVENTTGHFEGHDAMARVAIDVCYGMPNRLPQCRTRSIGNMAGITGYTRTDNFRTGVVGVGIQKTGRGMTVTAFSVGDRVGAGRGVVFGGCLACSDGSVVTTAAHSGYTRMIEAAVRIQLQESGGIVAVIAFGFRRCMKWRFTDGQYAVVAFTAISKHFLVIDQDSSGESKRSMAGLAHITGGMVIRHFRKKQITV